MDINPYIKILAWHNRVWVIFNDIYNSRNGIRNEETDVAWLIGNRIHHIEGFAIGLEKKSDNLYRLTCFHTIFLTTNN